MSDLANYHLRLPMFLLLLLLFLVFYPFVHQAYPQHLAVLEGFFLILMISGVSLLTHQKKLQFFMVLLAVLILVGIYISGLAKSHLLLSIVLLMELCFFSVIFIKILSHIFHHREVTLNSLYSAITSYLVLGIMFAIFYTMMGMLSPDFFHYTAFPQPVLKTFPHPSFFGDALYFSFVTLSTLGYGDWIPFFGPIQMIASLEAIIGQMFIAILIARLVSMQRR